MSWGNADIFQSRRIAFEKCEWWKRSDFGESVPLYKVAYEKIPAGSFNVEESNPPSSQIISSGDIKYRSSTVTIMTTDDVYGKIHENDLVSYCHKIWRVANISLRRQWKASEFSKTNNYGYKILVLRG